jgi:hypothetical protein
MTRNGAASVVVKCPEQGPVRLAGYPQVGGEANREASAARGLHGAVPAEES